MTAIYFKCTYVIMRSVLLLLFLLLLLLLLMLLSNFNQNHNAPKNFCSSYKYEISPQSVQLESHHFRTDKKKDRLTA